MLGVKCIVKLGVEFMKKVIGVFILIITIFILYEVVIILSSAAGQKNSLPYKVWKNMDEMSSILGEDYLYLSYLPGGVPIEKAVCFSSYNEFKNRDLISDNFNSYDIIYDNIAYKEVEPNLIKHGIYSAHIVCRLDGEGEWNEFYTPIEELIKDPESYYNSYLYLFEDVEIIIDGSSVFLSAFYKPNTISGLNVSAYCSYKGRLYGFDLSFFNHDILNLEKDLYEKNVLDFVKEEISKSLLSMRSY